MQDLLSISFLFSFLPSHWVTFISTNMTFAGSHRGASLDTSFPNPNLWQQVKTSVTVAMQMIPNL